VAWIGIDRHPPAPPIPHQAPHTSPDRTTPACSRHRRLGWTPRGDRGPDPGADRGRRSDRQARV